MSSIHLASDITKKRKGVFDSNVTKCGVFKRPRLVTFNRRQVTCKNCSGTAQPKGRRPGQKVKITRSIVVDEPGHPVSAVCTLTYCQDFELRAALHAIYTAARGDAKGEFWSIRKYLDDRDIYNGDISYLAPLVELVCKHALRIT